MIGEKLNKLQVHMNVQKDKCFPWGEILSDTDSFKQDIDSISFFNVFKKDNELILSNNLLKGEVISSRFIIPQSDHIFIVPGLPELPVVIKPVNGLSILPGQVFHTFIEVPLVFQLHCGTLKSKLLLQEISSQELSRSWFGDPDNGEIAYYLESAMATSVDSLSKDYFCIHCPVTINNKTNQILSLERMILRVPYLTIYKSHERLYTNRTKIIYRGQDQISQINILKTPPDVHEQLTVASLPRMAMDSGVLHKSFYFIKTLYNG
jgi:hypothetical protein